MITGETQSYIDVDPNDVIDRVTENDDNVKEDESEEDNKEDKEDAHVQVTQDESSSANELVIASVIGTLAVVLLGIAFFVFFSDTKPAVKSREQNISRESIEKIIGIALERNQARNDRERSHEENRIDYAELAEKVMPSMVRINTNIGMGSGFFVNNAGDVMTNYHVIENAREIIVIPLRGDPTYALVKDYDAQRDVALLATNIVKSPFLTISHTLPRQGESVMAVGNPQELDGTVSNGIISAFRDNGTLIQFTAPISPGSSGGALINSRGEVVGMPKMLRVDGQNLNFAIAPTILLNFYERAKNKTPRAMPKVASRKPESNPTPKRDSELFFIRKDDSYEVYLDTESVNYDRESNIVSFNTTWYPSEKTKQQIERDPNFDLIPGKELGIFVLSYLVDFSRDNYVHLRTVNFYADGSVARDYIRPKEQAKWEAPKKGSRIADLMQELRRRLNPKNSKRSSPERNDNSGITLPNKNGFLAHKWGDSIASVRKRVSAPLKRVDDSNELYSTYRPYKIKELNSSMEFYVTYGFVNDGLWSVIFSPVNMLISEADFELLSNNLVKLYGLYMTEKHEGALLGRIWYVDGMGIVLEYERARKELAIAFVGL